MALALVGLSSCENDLVNAPPSDSIINIGDTAGNLVGTWNLISLNFVGTNVVTSDDGIESQEIQGIGSDFNYLFVFSESPNRYTITGSYDIQYSVTVNGEIITQNSDDISASSNGTWTKNGNTFTTIETNSGKVVNSTIEVLNDTTLKFINVVVEEDNAIAGQTAVRTITNEYVFERL